jgi:hypothetical protein
MPYKIPSSTAGEAVLAFVLDAAIAALRHSDFGHWSFIRGFGFRHCFGILHSGFVSAETGNDQARMPNE